MYLSTVTLFASISCLYGQYISPHLINILESQICLQPRRCMPSNQCRNSFANSNSFPQSEYNQNDFISVETISRNKIILRIGKEAEVCEHTERCCGVESSNLSNNYLNSIITNTGSGYGRGRATLPTNKFPVTSGVSGYERNRATLPNINLPGISTGLGNGRRQIYNTLPNNNYPDTSGVSGYGRNPTTLPNINLPGISTDYDYGSGGTNNNLPNSKLDSSIGKQNTNFPINPCLPNTDINIWNREENLNSLGSPPSHNNSQPQKTSCGYRRQNLINFKMNSPDIIEQKAGIGEFPWIIALLVQKPSDTKMKFFCGASLIHPKVVVTAAHCINRKAVETITVRAGESNQNDEDGKFQMRNAIEIVRHEDYNELSAFNDIALILIDKPFVLNDFIQTICLPTHKMEIDDEQQCYSTGWDTNSSDAITKSEYILMKSQVRVLPATTCQNELRRTRLGLYFQLHASFKCASGPKGQDPCSGDGGSPLICPMEGEDNRFYQTGIVSWGIGCRHNNVPGVYVDVAVQRAWIDRKMEEKQFGTQSYT